MNFNQINADFLYKVHNTDVKKYPFPHFYVESALDENLYKELEENWPEEHEMRSLSDSGWVSKGTYKERWYIDCFDSEMLTKLSEKKYSVWKNFRDSFCSSYVWSELAKLCTSYFEENPFLSAELSKPIHRRKIYRLKPWMLIMTDYNGYILPPHTQHPQEMLVMLIYFSEDRNTEDAGTSIFVPIDRDFECDGGPHYQFEDFNNIYTAPYRRNSLFGFIKTKNSFHGSNLVQQPVVRKSLYVTVAITDEIPQRDGEDLGIEIEY